MLVARRGSADESDVNVERPFLLGAAAARLRGLPRD